MGASGLGALLVKEGFLTEQDRVTITKTCGQGSWAFAKCILSTGLLDEDELSAFFAERTRYVVAPKNLLEQLDTGIIDLIDRRMVSRLEVLPLEIDHHKITVAVADPLDKSTLKQLEFFTGLEVVSVIAPLSQIYEGLSRLNPDFKPRPTALSNFLRNHAGAAWIKQKIVEEGDVDVSLDKQSHSSASHGANDNIEDVSMDDEMEALEESNDNLSGIDAGGLDEGIGNSDFDDIELEDNGSDLELSEGDHSHADLDASESIDDAGLDVDDPFDSFDDAPKPKKSAAAADDFDIGGDSTDDLWPEDDDEPAAKPAKAAAKPAAAKPAAAKPAVAAADDLWPDDDDEPAKPAAKPAKPAKPAPKPTPVVAAADDMWPEEEEESVKAEKSADDSLSAASDLDDDFGLDGEASEAASDDLLGDTPDLDLEDDEEKVSASSDDFGLDDQPEGLDESPKAKSAQKADADDFGLGDDSISELGFDDEPKAKPAKKSPVDDLDSDDALSVSDDLDSELGFDDEPKAKTAKKSPVDDLDSDDALSVSDDLDSDLGFEDELKAKPAKKSPVDDLDSDDALSASDELDDDISFDDEPKAKPAKKSPVDDLDSDDALSASDELEDDISFDDEPKAKPAKKSPVDDLDSDDALSASDELEDDISFDDEPKAKPAKKSSVDDLLMGAETNDALDDASDDAINSLLDEPAPQSNAAGKDLLGFDHKATPESTRMAVKPVPFTIGHDDDHESVEFAEDDETSVSLRKAVHEDGVLPEFTDPSFDAIDEDTRIDLHAAKDDSDAEFGERDEETQIKLHPDKNEDADQLEDLAMGFDDAEAIDEPLVLVAKPTSKALDKEPDIGAIDFNADVELDDIPINDPVVTPLRSGGKSAPVSSDNGSVASLTATAKANEALLRMSLCFDRNAALEIAREYLPQISGTGCLIDIGKTTEALATWRRGAQSVTKDKPSPAMQSMAKAAKPGQWSQVPVSGKDELFGSVKSISIYAIKKADGRTLLLAGDYPIEDETLREALKSFAEQLGTK